MATVTVNALVHCDTLQTTLVPGGTADVAVWASNPNDYAVQAYASRSDGTATSRTPASGIFRRLALRCVLWAE